MIDKKLKIGIWGFGLVGQSLLTYFKKAGYPNLLIYDQQISNLASVSSQAIIVCELTDFLVTCDIIYPSPGIDLTNYEQYRAKFCSELDLFMQNWPKPVLAITGTLGKTTLTTVLTQLLNQAGFKAIAAGNIGLPMLDVLGADYDLAVLEVSSFQLELSNNFAPDLAIWTNFYANHLDRHHTMAAYFNAKAQIFLKQTKKQITLLPTSLLPMLSAERFLGAGQLYFFDDQNLTNLDLLALWDNFPALGLFRLVGKQLVLTTPKSEQVVGDLSQLAAFDTYQINLVILLAVVYLKKITLPTGMSFTPIEHRVELFLEHNQIKWYNDSKSTVGQATLAAVTKLAAAPIILFLGGMSKGVDRTDLIKGLVGKVKLVICFGGEADSLARLCAMYGLPYAAFAELGTALNFCVSKVQRGDQVLFSPAGASFDLFKNYMERGQIFKRQVLSSLDTIDKIDHSR